MTKRQFPPTPFLDSLLEKYGFEQVNEKYFDKELSPLPSAPQKLKDEVALLRSISPSS